jgi:hypothetical protein
VSYRIIPAAMMSVLCWLSPMRNVVLARRAAAGQGLPGVEVRQADAGLVVGLADVLPADVLLLCGIFGNVSDRDIQRTVQAASALCRAGPTVIWTRHRRPPAAGLGTAVAGGRLRR